MAVRGKRGAAAAVGIVWSAVAAAQTAPVTGTAAPAQITLPTIEVVGTSPLPGTGIDRDKMPAAVESLTSSDLSRAATPSLVTGLTEQAGSVSINATLVDAFQPDILYRGFEASPVLGTPQGLAVYQNGVRVNEAFGDTVNWDLIPDIAIDRLDIVSANPVYGLNALGGAVLVTMKDGFSWHGYEAEGAGGSFGQREGSFQLGKQVGDLAAYLAGRTYDSDGWRKFSPDHVRQLYGDLGLRGERAEVHVSFSGADNALFGAGTTPIQTLAIDRTLDFTTPQNNINQLEFVTVTGTYHVGDDWSLAANAYRREFHQTVANGDTTHYTACADAPGLLCQRDAATPLLGAAGGAIPDLSQGGALPIGQNDRETIHAVSLGGAAQTTYSGALWGHPNHFVFGGSLDHSDVDVHTSTEVGLFNPALQLLPSGLFVDSPEGTDFPATPVSLTAGNDYYGIFATDTVNLTPALAVTASGRYNIALISLLDHRGGELTGSSRYSRFNPAIGATYKITADVTAYAGYSEGNRAPTPSEIECSNPARPCLLPSSLSSDPPTLKQVVSHTYEAGLRGGFPLPALAPGRFRWHVDLFRTDLDDDIYGVATAVSAGFFRNIGATRRQGIETGLAYKDDTWSAYVNYSLIDATFRSALALPSPNNPFADENGDIHVSPGDRLPGIPMHQLKAGADYRIIPDWTVGAALSWFGDQYLRGDESNQNPPLPGYEVVTLHSSYRVTPHAELFATVANVFNARYATFAQFGDPVGIGAPGVPANGVGADHRFLAPAPPIAVFGGIRVRF